MPNLYSFDCNNRNGYCKVEDLFCKNKSYVEQRITLPTDKKTFIINKKVRVDSLSVLDINKRPISANDYVITWNTGTIVFKNPQISDIFVNYDEIAPLVSTDIPTTVVVEFWFYWTGRYNVIPFSFQNYGLMFYKENFGFTTKCNDIYGISSLGMERKWTHVYAVFDSQDVNNNKLYINGELKILKQRTGNPTANLNVSNNAQISGWLDNGNYKFDGLIDEFRIWTNINDVREIKRNMYRVLDLSNENFNGLIAYYRFDTTDNKIIDYSVNKRSIFNIGGIYSTNTQELDGYNKPQEIIVLNPTTQILKNSEYNLQYLIKPADPRYTEVSMQLTSNGSEQDTAFFVHEIDKENWTKIVDLKVW